MKLIACEGTKHGRKQLFMVVPTEGEGSRPFHGVISQLSNGQWTAADCRGYAPRDLGQHKTRAQAIEALKASLPFQVSVIEE